MRKYYLFITILTALVAVLLGVTFTLGGTPISERDSSFDAKRISDFSLINTAIQAYYSSKGTMPASLTELVSDYLTSLPKDPQTQKDYEFKPGSGITYSLCTVFSTDTSSSGQPGYRPYGTNTKHKKGQDCMTFTASTASTNFPRPGESFATLIGKQYFVVQVDADSLPKAPFPNDTSGILVFNNLELSHSGTYLYDIKDNPNDYFLVLQSLIRPSKGVCQGPGSISGCTYSFSFLNLHDSNGNVLKKNLVGTKDYIDVSGKWANIPQAINFPPGGDAFGAIGFFVPKSILTPSQETSLTLSYDAGEFESSKQPLDISITVK